MARNPRTPDASPAQVAEEALPGWKAVKETSLEKRAGMTRTESYDADAPVADAVMPSLDQLKAKYLGADAAAADAPPADADVAADEADTSLVELESGPLKKTVAVSKRQKKVIWSQG